METVHQIREATVVDETQVSLPADVLHQLEWEAGLELVVNVVNKDTIILSRRPTDWAGAFAGGLTGVFGTHEEVLRHLDDGRRSWDSEE